MAENSPRNNKLLAITVSLMLLSGSSNDFLGKLIYQLLPGNDNGTDNLDVDYWATVIITMGQFMICAFAIISGRESFKILTCRSFLKICVPAVMDLFVDTGRYLALIFLPSALISILKNGSQLMFLAIIRIVFLKKLVIRMQWLSIVITIAGLVIVSVAELLSADSNDAKFQNTCIGLIIIVTAALLGAVRNSTEEIILQDLNFHSDFVVGMESIIASVILVFVAIFLLLDDPFHKDSDLKHHRLVLARDYIFDSNKGYAIIVCFVLFLIAIYGKETMQMKTTMLSSSLSRKIYEQMYPSITWTMSLITYYAVSELYGEGWNKWSWLRLFGFVVVGAGCSLYMKALNKSKEIEKERKAQQKLLSEDFIDTMDNDIGTVDGNAKNIQQA